MKTLAPKNKTNDTKQIRMFTAFGYSLQPKLEITQMSLDRGMNELWCIHTMAIERNKLLPTQQHGQIPQTPR